MSYMRGDLLTKKMKLVKGLAKPTPTWLKAMEEAPPVTFPRTDGKMKKIELSEDVYVKRFFKKHPDSLYHDVVNKLHAFKFRGRNHLQTHTRVPLKRSKQRRGRFFNPKILEIVKKLKAEKVAEMQDQGRGGPGFGQPGGWNANRRW